MDLDQHTVLGTGWFSGHSTELLATGITLVIYLILRVGLKKLACRYGQMTNKTECRVLQVRKIISMLINVLFFMLVVVIWGVRGENLILGMATAITFLGVALFAQWSIVSNITAGIIMYFSAPFRLGDNIVIMEKDMPLKARIEDIKTFYTHLRTDKNELVVLPNNLFLQKLIVIEEGDNKNY